MTVVRRFPKVTFALGALAISSLSQWVVASSRFNVHPGPLSYAVLADLVVTMPIFYYWVVVRSRSVPVVTMLPIMAIGLLRARMILPGKQFHHLPGVELLVGSAEFAVLLWVGLRAAHLRQAYRRAGLRESTFIGTFAEAMRESFGRSLFTSAVIPEVSTLYFALFSWRSEPQVQDDAIAVTSHRRTGWGAVLVAIAMIVTAEAVAIHVLLSLWSTKLAWVLTSLSGYSLLWLLGDYRAMTLRPTLLTSNALHLRIGMRWQAEIPLSEIRAVRPYQPTDALLPGYRRVTVMGGPQWAVDLRKPIVLEGPLGIRRTASCLGIVTDQANFGDVLRARL
jgi:hypothetical protein